MGKSGNLFHPRKYAARILKRIEKELLGRPPSACQPQFFILGLPRSGTTLIYQYIVHRLDVAYFPNPVGRYFDSPCAITWLSRMLFPPYCSDFASRYGKVMGRMAPREAGNFWLRFFSLDDYTNENQLNAEQAAILQKIIRCVQDIFHNAPFVNKNVKHLLRIGALASGFPDSYFIVVEREFADIGLSILEARRKAATDPADWWSVRPPAFDRLKELPIADQIAGQVFDLNEKMAADLNLLAPERVLRTVYRDFCRNPEGMVARIKEICPGTAYKNEKVDRFEYREKKIGGLEEEILVEKINMLFKK
jgi:hypothetical protein